MRNPLSFQRVSVVSNLLGGHDCREYVVGCIRPYVKTSLVFLEYAVEESMVAEVHRELPLRIYSWGLPQVIRIE
jgi:DICT domain-containing protein